MLLIIEMLQQIPSRQVCEMIVKCVYFFRQRCEIVRQASVWKAATMERLLATLNEIYLRKWYVYILFIENVLIRKEIVWACIRQSCFFEKLVLF